MPSVPTFLPPEGPYRFFCYSDEGDEYFYMVNPRPWHQWQGVEDMGYMIPMADAAKVLREVTRE